MTTIDRRTDIDDIDDTDGSNLDRRRFLQLTGAAIAGTAILAACGNGDNDAAGDENGAGDEGDGEDGKGSESDVRTLRTAASIQLAAVAFYTQAIDGGRIPDAVAEATAKVCQTLHQEHADLFNAEAKGAGGEAVEEPNAGVLQSLQTMLSQAKDEAGVLTAALQLENTMVATYLANVGTFDDGELDRVAMSVGGVSARLAAVLAGLVRQPTATKAFFTADGAIAPGSGL